MLTFRQPHLLKRFWGLFLFQSHLTARFTLPPTLMCKEMRDLNNNLLHLLTLLCFNFKYLKRLFAKPLIDMKRQENVLLETNFRDYIFISPSTLWVTWLLGKQFSYCQASEVINKWMLCWISVSVRTLYRTHNLKLAGLLWIQLKYLRKKVGNKYMSAYCVYLLKYI